MYFCLPDFDAFQEKMFSNFMIHEFLLWYNYLSLLFLSVFFHGAFQKLGFLYLIFYEFSILWCCFFLVVDMFFGFSYHDFVEGYFRLFIVVFHGHFIIFFICCFFLFFVFVFSSLSTTTRQWNLCLRYLLHMLVEAVHRNYDKTKNVGRDKVETGRHRKWVFQKMGVTYRWAILKLGVYKWDVKLGESCFKHGSYVWGAVCYENRGHWACVVIIMGIL